jgi:hypothetical protein
MTARKHTTLRGSQGAQWSCVQGQAAEKRPDSAYLLPATSIHMFANLEVGT